jgi:hypothetical protein
LAESEACVHACVQLGDVNEWNDHSIEKK